MSVELKECEGIWVAKWPFMGQISSGYTKEDALLHLIEDVQAVYKAALEHGLQLPHERWS